MTQARLPNLGDYIYGEMDQIALERLVSEIETLLPLISTGPWKADIKENVGKNWLLASMGADRDGAQWILTTDHVHASELDGDAEADAKFCAAARNVMPLLIEALRKGSASSGRVE